MGTGLRPRLAVGIGKWVGSKASSPISLEPGLELTPFTQILEGVKKGVNSPSSSRRSAVFKNHSRVAGRIGGDRQGKFTLVHLTSPLLTGLSTSACARTGKL